MDNARIERIARELNQVSFQLDNLSRRVERLTNELCSKVKTPRQPPTLDDIMDDKPITFGR